MISWCMNKPESHYSKLQQEKEHLDGAVEIGVGSIYLIKKQQKKDNKVGVW